MSTRMLRMAAAICLVLTCCVAQKSAANESKEAVRQTLGKMHDWVGENANGQQWRKFLRSEELLSELAKESNANPEVVGLALERYQSGAPGLDMGRFVAVRDALGVWHAELTLPPVESLSEVARSAKDSFQEITPEALEAKRGALKEKVVLLENYLNTGGKNGKAWKDYLKWDSLNSHTAKGAEINIPKIDGTFRQFRKNFEGIELDVFQDTAKALEAFYGVAAVHSNPKSGELFAGQLDRLATSLEKYPQNPTERESVAIGSRVGWLESSGQTPELVHAVRSHLSRPNLVVQVSERFINAGMGRKVNERRPVTDNILGTYITGEGHTVGAVSVDLKPSKQGARIDTVLNGKIMTDTVGSNGPVFIYSDGVTKIHAVKEITLTDHGITDKPATCQATTNSEVTGISTKRAGRVGDRMIQKIAWRRIDQQHGQAEQIGAEHAERRVEEAVNADAKERLAKAQKDFEGKYRHPLIRRGQFPKLLRFHSSEDYLFVTALQANPYQLAAPSEPPKIAKEKSDIVVRVHESTINNLAGGLLAGMTYTDTDLAGLGERLGDEWEEKLKSPEDEDPWSITFASVRPVTIVFGENEYTVTIRGKRYTSGERKFNAMDISATYTMEMTPTGAKLMRKGDINISPPGFKKGEDKLSASQVALRRILARRMVELFPPEVIADGKPLKGDWAKVGILRLDELTSGSGWLTLGWYAPEIDRLTTKATTTQASK